MPKRFSVKTENGVFHIKKVVRNTVRIAIPMITAAFIAIGSGMVLTEQQLIALASQPPIQLTYEASNINDGKQYSDNWRLNSNNDWEYYENGKKVTNAWVHDHGQWYLLGNDGIMRTGLFESYGKYYLLDDVRGTGTYGKLLKNGGNYKGVTISADTSSDYEGALSESTLNSLAGLGHNRQNAVTVTGTQHAGDTVQNAAQNTIHRGETVDGVPVPDGFYQGGYAYVASKDGKTIVYMLDKDGDTSHEHAIGLDGVPYKCFIGSTSRRFSGATSAWNAYRQYVDTGKIAPDGGYYWTASHFSESDRISYELGANSLFRESAGLRGKISHPKIYRN